MRKLLAITFFLSFGVMVTKGQTIVEQLQQAEEGKGTVTVSQSKEIENLVNGTKVSATASKPATQTNKQPEQQATKQATKTVGQDNGQNKTKTVLPQKPDSTEESKTDANSETEAKHETMKRTPVHTDIDTETYGTDTRKKVMRNAVKVTGYRVQVYSGGSSRNDRQKAQDAANKVKAKYPQLPVYVHFYSPSWKCRVGNFRSYEEANKVLKQLKAMGYKQACIVKGKISVQ